LQTGGLAHPLFGGIVSSSLLSHAGQNTNAKHGDQEQTAGYDKYVQQPKWAWTMIPAHC